MSTSLMWLLDGIAAVPAMESRGVVDLTLDSREVRPGSLFFALPGRTAHGLKFATEAAARGASVVLWEPGAQVSPPKLPATVFAAAIPGLKGLVGRIADRFFNWPSSQLRITGITGTNGKTTCAYLLAQCLERLGSQAAYIGTIGWGRIASLEQPTLTTPDVVTLHRELAALRASGVREVAMEVSSQALDQDRVAGVRLHSAAFTNLSRDHLDYHETMAAYGAAKARLFDAPDLKHIVVNVGDAFGRELARKLAGRVPLTAVWIGAGESGWLAERALRAAQVALDVHGVSMQLDGSFGKAQVATRLLGRFNAENALVVIACLLSLGTPLAEAARVLAECVPPPGRMEVVEAAAGDKPAAGDRLAAGDEPAAGDKPMAVVDYAHTPDALAQALRALREHCKGALWCVFGCGGDRDPGKRSIMGAVADELADRIIVTDDNPRSENPEIITRAIVSGIKSRNVRVIHDRGEAIGTALTEAAASDVVLIAGKGHEDYQIYGGTRRSFSDRREAQRHLGAAA
ncbi:MAG TPA: UDP-N-acetylmuramoyl-L-alanyl-D-glutamate--2,6-diaminopimelate ligase [Steroidobacteraceae bacterium]